MSCIMQSQPAMFGQSLSCRAKWNVQLMPWTLYIESQAVRLSHELPVIQLSCRSVLAGSVTGAWATELHGVVIRLLNAMLHAQ